MNEYIRGLFWFRVPFIVVAIIILIYYKRDRFKEIFIAGSSIIIVTILDKLKVIPHLIAVILVIIPLIYLALLFVRRK
ncbi:MAG TPA: hypothetical protein ENL20_06715 [Candidatus Cloacimonetes bacterium]|nr:hypothetical protein [Candidatus Cloacimonadota bacterium]